MLSDQKLFFVREYFADFREKVNRLGELFRRSFREEALILCIVYIDYLASGTYYDGTDRNKENFCRALCELSQNDFFSAIHPKQLLKEAQKLGRPGVQSEIQKMLNGHPGRFLTQDEITAGLKSSQLESSVQVELRKNLWRASVSAICYTIIRCQSIHGPGHGMDLSFDETAFRGQAAATINFDLMYQALQAILSEVESVSLKTGEFFGNPQYG
jgi:hypothetical protein